MKHYSVEVRITYEVDAESAEDALRQVSSALVERDGIFAEYLVRERHEAAASAAPQRDDYQGLDKPVYTVAEVASYLGSSRASVYEMVRRGIKCIRMGRRVLIPRGTILAILNGEVRLEDREVPPPPPLRRPAQRVQESPRAVVTPAVPVRQHRAKTEKSEPKSPVSATEAASTLRISVPRLRELMAQRKIYYVDHGRRPRVPLKAIENFANGLPARALLEENIAHYKASGSWDDEDEQIATKLLAEWTVTDDEPDS